MAQQPTNKQPSHQTQQRPNQQPSHQTQRPQQPTKK